MRPQWTTKLLAFSLISLLAYGAYLGLAPDSPVQPDPANQAHRTKNDAFSSGPEHSSAIAEREARENVETYSGSLEQKGLETKKQAMAHFGLTEEEINSQSAALATVIVDKSASDLFRNELKNALIEQYGSDEGSFLFYTTSITEWSELKAAVRERSELTGLAYDDLLLRQGIMMGEITADELLSLTASAGAVPEDIALQLAATANFEALIELTKNGLIADPNYIDPLTGKNALAALIQAAGQSHHNVTNDTAITAISEFIDAGAEVSPQNGAFNPLDYALRTNRNNADLNLEIAKLLLQAGVPVEESHRQLIRSMPEGPQRDAFLEVFANNM